MKELNPFFSIVIPAYNRVSFLPDTIKSISKQDFDSYEIIVIDDGSTDNTVEILRQLEIEFHRLKHLSIPNSERGTARNIGIKESKGEFIITFDSDDIMHPGHLSTLHHAIGKNKEINFFATKFDFLRNNNRYPHPNLKAIKEGIYNHKFFLNGNHLACNICFRKKGLGYLFREERELAIMEDWIFHLENLEQNQLYLIDEVTISMKDHDDRSMRQSNELIIERRLKATEWLLRNKDWSKQDKNILQEGTYYFCAIHSYIDKKKKEAKKYLKQAVSVSGWKIPYLKLLLKIYLF